MADDEEGIDPEDLEDLEEIDVDEDGEVFDDDGEDFDDDEDDDDGGEPRRTSAGSDDDDDDDEPDPDDVEDDLDTILKDRIASGDDDDDDEEDDDEKVVVKTPDKPADPAQEASDVPAKRSDEWTCEGCFLIVAARQFGKKESAVCPSGESDCPSIKRL